MASFTLIIKHKTQPGRRDEVRKVWERHMAPAIAANPGHVAYIYCFDNGDPDSIYAFVNDVEPLLSGPPQIIALTPAWSKGA
jgi:hypothetical protein